MFKPIWAIFVFCLGANLVLLTSSTNAADEIKEPKTELKEADEIKELKTELKKKEYTILDPPPSGMDDMQFAVGLGEAQALPEARYLAIQNAKGQLANMCLTGFQVVDIKATEEKGRYLVQVLMALPLEQKLAEAPSDEETNLDRTTTEVLKLEAALDTNSVREIEILKPPSDTDGLLYTVGLGESQSLVRAKQLAIQDAKVELLDTYLLGVSVVETVVTEHNGLHTVQVMMGKPIKDNSLETSSVISMDEEMYQEWRASEGFRDLERAVEEQKKTQEQAPEAQQKPQNKE